MHARRIFLTTVIGVWLAALAVITLPLRLELAHSYAHQIGPPGEMMLPIITSRFALPLLRGGDSAGAAMMFYGYWAVVWLGPLGLLRQIWRARDATAVLETWSYLGGAYALFVALSWIFLAAALALPFAPL